MSEGSSGGSTLTWSSPPNMLNDRYGLICEADGFGGGRSAPGPTKAVSKVVKNAGSDCNSICAGQEDEMPVSCELQCFFVLADTSVRSPRKLFIIIMKTNIFSGKVSQKSII